MAFKNKKQQAAVMMQYNKRGDITKSNIIDRNVSIASRIDNRSDIEIANDMKRNVKKIEYSPEYWMGYESEKDLYGWDDTTIHKYHKKFSPENKIIIKKLESQFPDAVVSGRIKTMPSVVGKLKKKNIIDPPFSHTDMEDISGLRLTFDNTKDLLNAVPAVKKTFNVVEVEDYVTHPKSSGYRSVHIIIEQNKIPTELQIRTHRMNTWADWSHDLMYKESGVYKSLSPTEKKQVEKYVVDMSEYYSLLDLNKSAKQPHTPDVVTNKIGAMKTK